MKKVLLGNTGMYVSVIGFGGIPIQRVDQEYATKLIIEAKNRGINFIDTAQGYTVSEKYIGNALKEAGRENFYIATKSMSYDYNSMKKAIEKSLSDMQLDYIDLFQVHNVGKQEQLDMVLSEDGALKALLEAKEQGLIKHIGITGHLKELMMKAIEHDEFETIQFPFNPVESQGVELFKKALKKNMGTIAMKPMAGGAFTKQKLSLKYIINSNLINVAIPGMDSIEQVVENASVGECSEPLTIEEQEELNKEVEILGNDFCRRCGYCKPCPEGIDIPSVFLFEGYVTRYNLPEYGRNKYEAMPIKATACVRCRKCEGKCPYNLPIVDKLKHAVETFKNL
ncbi:MULTISPECIES: aldo/keto reductase [unclassified Sedimentibacter]|uniref:aldo/keto reductase n=1 Tax=unclassified Sedimentibacter TaxID=2649220 RepID=UPI0027DF8F67|nr:aldo/keto reductase [Sedimentibacter sp. MB35-C1]WMJ77909.1 aldo/keto reductase [Sedimentibacter sp. MB35-C1]